MLASIPPRGTDRWVIVAAHYDHLGQLGGQTFWGADDNAAAVGILIDTARGLAKDRPYGRGVLFAAFDGEEPPHFLSDAMGSRWFAKHPTIPLDRIDMMICMDLVGHTFGPAGTPDEVGQSMFALGAERSQGTLDRVRSLERSTDGVIVRAADADIIPPLSDYEAFWQKKVPFLFLTSGRSRYYHTVEDKPEHLDWTKMAATASWLEGFVRETCTRDGIIKFDQGGRADLATLEGLADILRVLGAVSPEAAQALELVEGLKAACNTRGELPGPRRAELKWLVEGIESRLA